MLLNEHRPELAVFSDTWLDSDTPDEAVKWPGMWPYHVTETLLVQVLSAMYLAVLRCLN